MPTMALLLEWGLAERVEKKKPVLLMGEGAELVFYPRHEHKAGVCTLPPEIDQNIQEALEMGYSVHDICDVLDKLAYDNYLEHKEEFIKADQVALQEYNNQADVKYRLSADDAVGFTVDNRYLYCILCVVGHPPERVASEVKFAKALDVKNGFICSKCSKDVLRAYGEKFKIVEGAKKEGASY